MCKVPVACCAAAAAAVVLCLILASPASARYEKLDRPRVAFGAGYPADARQKVDAALEADGCEFVGGHALNAWTSLRYRGDARALGRMLDELVKCPGVTVHVSFREFDELLGDEHGCDWHIGHRAPDHHFEISVNLASDRLRLEELSIPVFTGPELKP